MSEKKKDGCCKKCSISCMYKCLSQVANNCDHSAVDYPIQKGSICGLLLPLVATLIVLAFYSNQIDQVINEKEVQVLVPQQISNAQVMTLSTSGNFYFNIFIFPDNATDQIWRYISLDIHHVTSINQGQTKNQTDIQPVQCSSTIFDSYNRLDTDYQNQSSIIQRIEKNGYCLNLSTNIALQGNYSSQIFQYLRVTIQKCRGQACANSSEVKQWMTTSRILNVYFLDNLIIPRDVFQSSTFINSNNYIDIAMPDRSKYNLLINQQRYSKVYDIIDLYFDKDNTEQSIYQVEDNLKADPALITSKDIYAKIYFKKGNKSTIININVQGVFYIFGKITFLLSTLLIVFFSISKRYSGCQAHLAMVNGSKLIKDQYYNRMKRYFKNLDQPTFEGLLEFFDIPVFLFHLLHRIVKFVFCKQCCGKGQIYQQNCQCCQDWNLCNSTQFLCVCCCCEQCCCEKFKWNQSPFRQSLQQHQCFKKDGCCRLCNNYLKCCCSCLCLCDQLDCCSQTRQCSYFCFGACRFRLKLTTISNYYYILFGIIEQDYKQEEIYRLQRYHQKTQKQEQYHNQMNNAQLQHQDTKKEIVTFNQLQSDVHIQDI